MNAETVSTPRMRQDHAKDRRICYTSTGGSHAFLDSSGVFTDITPLANPGDDSTATAINVSGQIVGTAPDGSTGYDEAFLYAGGILTEIDGFGCDTPSQGTGINNGGQVVGNYSFCGGGGTDHAFLYSGGVVTDLGTLGDSGAASFATGINDSGQVVGYSNTPGNDNNHLNDFDAFLYSGGIMTDLNSLLPANSGWQQLEEATGINDAGQIVGVGITDSGSAEAFLLDTEASPSPEPGSLALLGAGAAFFAVILCRRRLSILSAT